MRLVHAYRVPVGSWLVIEGCHFKVVDGSSMFFEAPVESLTSMILEDEFTGDRSAIVLSARTLVQLSPL